MTESAARVPTREQCSVTGCDKFSRQRGWCNKHYNRWRRHRDPLAGGTSNGAPMQWLHDHLNHTGDECLVWPFARSRNGRGWIRVTQGNGMPHQVMCKLRHGEPPTPEHEAAHSCGNGHLGCVNPIHLRWATKAENEADKLIHGTRARGERHGAAKLTEADVLAIRASTSPIQEIAETFGISQATGRHIKNRKIWAWL